jgi:hypothetical protein
LDVNSDIAKEAFTESDLYNDCDTPLNIVTDLLRSGDTPAVVTNITSIVSGHAFQNASHLNASPLHQVMLFKIPTI